MNLNRFISQRLFKISEDRPQIPDEEIVGEIYLPPLSAREHLDDGLGSRQILSLDVASADLWDEEGAWRPKAEDFRQKIEDAERSGLKVVLSKDRQPYPSPY